MGEDLRRRHQRIRHRITGTAECLEEWRHQDTRSWRVQPRSCTADGSDASHAAHEARGDGIGKREKVAWVARDWRDKGRGLLDVAQETYKFTACTTIESNEVNPPVSCVHLSPRDSAVALSSCLSSFDICRVLHCVCVCVAIALHLRYSLRTCKGFISLLGIFNYTFSLFSLSSYFLLHLCLSVTHKVFRPLLF